MASCGLVQAIATSKCGYDIDATRGHLVVFFSKKYLISSFLFSLVTDCFKEQFTRLRARNLIGAQNNKDLLACIKVNIISAQSILKLPNWPLKGVHLINRKKMHIFKGGMQHFPGP